MRFLSGIAVGLGVLGAFVALALLRLIGLCTHLFFYQRLGTALVSPAGHPLGALVIAVPVMGALIVGVMARYGSDRIRGHGIPEAIEAILIHGSRVQPRVAFLKPLSWAISIGSGGPFGAEGPIGSGCGLSRREHAGHAAGLGLVCGERVKGVRELRGASRTSVRHTGSRCTL